MAKQVISGVQSEGEPAGAKQSDGQTTVNTDPLPQNWPQGLSQVSVRLSEGEARHRQFRSITALFSNLPKRHGSEVQKRVCSWGLKAFGLLSNTGIFFVTGPYNGFN